MTTMPNDEPQEELVETETHIILVGGAGDNAAHMLIIKLNHSDYLNFKLMAANTDRRLRGVHFPKNDEHVKAWGDALILHQLGGNKVTKGRGAGTRPEVGRQAAETEESTKALTEFIKSADNIVICTGLGGGTGTGASQVIAELCEKEKKPTVVIAMMPDPLDEGDERLERATIALNQIRALQTTITISNAYIEEYIRKEMPEEEAEGVSSQQAWEIVNEHSLVPMIQFLHELLQVPGDVISTDQSNWETFLKHGNHLFIGWKYLDEKKIREVKVEEIVDELCIGHFQNKAIIDNGVAMIFLSHGPVPYLKKKAVKIKMRERICGRDEERAKKFEIIEGTCEKVLDDKVWIAVAIIAQSVPVPSDTPVDNRAAKADNDERPKATGVIQYTIGGVEQKGEVSAHFAKRFNENKDNSSYTKEEMDKLYADAEKELGHEIDKSSRMLRESGESRQSSRGMTAIFPRKTPTR